MITSVLLYLLLASLAGLLLMFMKRGHTGPEGPVGAWVVFVPGLALALLFFVAAGISGAFAWLAPNPLAWIVMAIGLLVCLGVASFTLLDRGPVRWLGMAAIVLVGVACFLAVHPPQPAAADGPRRLVTQILIGAPSLFGLAMLARAAFDRALANRRQLAREERDFQEAKRQRDAWDTEQFAALPVDAPFFAVSQYLWSPNDAVRTQARARLAQRPNLEAQMIEGLAIEGCDEAVASYIAYVVEHPSPSLAPAFAAALDRQLASWKSSRLVGPNPAQWEPNLSKWFEAAARLQVAGANLRPSLAAWRLTLEKIDGMKGLVRRIEEIE